MLGAGQLDVGHMITHRFGFDDFVEDRRRIELGCEDAARACELLRKRARGPLCFQEIAAGERATRRVGEVPGELEVFVGKCSRAVEEDKRQSALVRVSPCDGNCEQRVRSSPRQRIAERPFESVVIADVDRCDEPSVGDRRLERSRGFRQARRKRRRQARVPDQLELGSSSHEERGKRAAERIVRGLRERFECLFERQRFSENRGDLEEATLNAGLRRVSTAFALERCGELGCRASVIQRKCGIRCQRLQLSELVGAEGMRIANRRGRKHGDHAIACDERYIRDALRVERVHELPIDTGRRRVELGVRRGLENRSRDSGRLVLEVEDDPAKARDLTAVRLGS